MEEEGAGGRRYACGCLHDHGKSSGWFNDEDHNS